MAIYEWQDVKYLGKETVGDDDLPVSTHPCRCTTTAPVDTYLAENIYLVCFIVITMSLSS